MSARNLAPIVLFAYNRPRHTKQTLLALSQNELANQSDLYVFIDGIKSPVDNFLVESHRLVQEVVSSQQWCKNVLITVRERNYGLADNIVGGVTEVLSKHDNVIVLEDDIETAPGFLTYMNSALKQYKNDEKVMHISGFMFPVSQKLPPTFFYNTGSCWGWGTWKRAWKHYSPDAVSLLSQIDSKNLRDKFNIGGAYNFTSQLDGNIDGTLRTWAIKWYASFFLQGGHALHPYPSFTNNIGMDDSGSHTNASNLFYWNQLNNNVAPVQRVHIEESQLAIKACQEFFTGQTSSMNDDQSPGIYSMLKKIIPLKLKHQIVNYIINKYSPRKPVRKEEFPTLIKEERFIKQTIKLFGRDFTVTDSASFLSTYSEIFKSEIYRFSCTSHNPYIIDAGANIGLSIIYFKQRFPNAEIVAFEPDPETYEVLCNNVDSFELSKIKLVQKALWNTETTLHFFAEGADGGRLAIDSDKEQIIEVETIQLRQFLNRKVDLLKIDIEGAETTVLENCTDLLVNTERIFVEFHSFSEKEQELDRLLAILSEAGFRYYITKIGVTSTHPLDSITTSLGMDNQLNIFANRLKN